MVGLFWCALALVGLAVGGCLRRWQRERVAARQARLLFRSHREWLEADFLIALGKSCPTERLRWEEAHWNDTVLWARDRQTRRLLALIGVDFSGSEALFDGLTDPGAMNATALFEFRNGRWHAEGKRLEIQPDEVMRWNRRFEPLFVSPRQVF